MSSARGTSDPVRTRFAPSPTGFLHFGGARTALFCYLLAKKSAGAFLLRFEDTDLERSQPQFKEEILRSLEWLGLTPDEGGKVGGPFAPYEQSQRQDLYRNRLEKLRIAGAVYPCFCSKDRLDHLRKDQERRKLPPRYDGLCLRLSPEEVTAKLAGKAPHTLRFRIPREAVQEVVFSDLVHGSLSFKTRDLEDFIVVREDGTPPFLLPSLIDDLEMKVSHVLRGDDHLANTPKQILLAKALGQAAPTYGHLPLVLAEDGHPLSKRQGDLGIETLRQQGFLPAAITQSLLLLGWSPPPGTDANAAWTLAQQIDLFTIDRVHRAPARFDATRLRAVNRQQVSSFSAAALFDLLSEFPESKGLEKVDRQLMLKAIQMVAPEAETLRDFFNPLAAILNGPESRATASQLEKAGLGPTARILCELLDDPGIDSFATLTTAAANRGISGKSLFQPLRLALTGQEAGPKVADLFDLLGKERVIKRLRQVLL